MYRVADGPIEGIDNIVLDLGGVVIDLDRDRAVERLTALGLAEANEDLDQYKQSGIFLDLETGRVTPAEFYDELRRRITSVGNPAPTDKQLQDAFNGFLVALPPARLEAIRAIRARGKRVFALSNTNPVMYPSWIKQQFEQEGLTINDYFEGVVASFMEGCCKPNPLIFQRVTERYGLDPSSTIFFDDSEANCLGADAAGWHSMHIGYTPQTDLLAALKNII